MLEFGAPAASGQMFAPAGRLEDVIIFPRIHIGEPTKLVVGVMRTVFRACYMLLLMS